jgi:large subunit ribosomal protein L2
MPVKLYKPITNGRREASVLDFSMLTKKQPEKSLLKMLKSSSGRNNQGIITVRHRGAGVKKLYRVIDFDRKNYDEEGKVTALEYDPNRGPFIALVEYSGGKKAYVIAQNDLKVGDIITSSLKKIEPNVGNRMPLKHIPIGLFVNSIEISPGSGSKLVRGAGLGAQLQTIEGDYAQIKLPSGEMRLVLKDCSATVGTNCNSDHKLVRLGKAGRKRKMGWRPQVTGKAMNPVDHPHGGGEGHNPIGLKGGPKTQWGKKARGVKSRRDKKWSNKLIIQRRSKKK